MSDTTTTTDTTEKSKLPLGAEKVAKLVTQLGAGWARYGLTIGRLALQQSARALETTSEILGEVAQKFEKVAAEKPADEAAPKN
jgi:hypothetical protein